MLGWILGLAALAFAVWGHFCPETPPRPRRASEPSPAEEAIGEAIAGTIGLAGALVALLVWLSPLLILIWLVTR